MKKTLLLFVVALALLVRSVQSQEVDLVDAIRNGTVTAEGLGKGDLAVMTLRVTAGATINIVVRVGTLFTTECFRANKNNRDLQMSCPQPLIILVTKSVTVPGGTTVDIDLETACADLDLHIPEETDKFQVDQASPELLKLAQCMEEKNLQCRDSECWLSFARGRRAASDGVFRQLRQSRLPDITG
jgi:hypothetical protein